MSSIGPNWICIPEHEGIPAYHVFTKDIIKSPLDDREYRLIQLESGLRATIIHDPTADKAAASMDVGVGHLSDPDDIPGLAHFTEHLLFLGTELFPKENEYKEYLAKHNGRSNAYTSTSTTNYYFSVGTGFLEGALSRFAAFFHCPLFTPSCTSREMNAVNSENKKNLQTDSRRLFQLGKHLSRSGHPWRKFGTGNRETLLKAARQTVQTDPTSKDTEDDETGGPAGQESRRRLIEWWKASYSASRMRLCVIGHESLEDLTHLVARLFSPIPNSVRDPVPAIHEHPMGSDELGTLVRVQSIKKYHSLEISFPLEYPQPHWTYKPASFVAHFTGHEGPGSLHSYLKRKGWITSLSAGPQTLAKEFASFKFTLTLTEEGFMHYREVLQCVFHYIALLQKSNFEPYHQKEISLISDINFRFAEKSQPASYAQFVSTHMDWPVPEELLLSAPRLTRDWDSSPDALTAISKVHKYFGSFTLEFCRVFLVARKEIHELLPDYPPSSEWQTEPWYGTPYHVAQALPSLLTNEQISPNLFFLPHPNEFIPTNLEVDKRAVSQPSKRPFLIRKTPSSVLWHKKDDQFWVPRANLTVYIRSPLADTSARVSVMRRLYASLISDQLTEYTYDASLAGLHYGFTDGPGGFTLEIFGYNHKLATLLDRLLWHIKAASFQPDRLLVMKEKTKRGWENFHLSAPHSLADYYANYILTQKIWTPEERLALLADVSVEDIQECARNLFTQVQLRVLINGNIDALDAIRITERVEEGLGLVDIPSSAIDAKCLLLAEGQNATYVSQNHNPHEVNSALTYYVHFGSLSDQRLRVASALLIQILSEPAFSTLRTKEQLGYIVWCTGWTLSGSTEKGMRIAVQSEKHPAYLEERVEAFLTTMEAHIESLSEETFREQKAGLQKKWTEKDKKLAEETLRFEVMIANGQWDFLRGWNDAQLLEEVAKDEVMSLFKRHVDPMSNVRSKLDAVEVIAGLQEFKKTMKEATTPPPCVEWGDLSDAKL